ncbi:unnamed protein product [Caenorhabditis nigoni]
MDGNQEEIKRMENKKMQDDGWKLYGEIVRRRDGDSEDSEVPSSKTCSLKGELRTSRFRTIKVLIFRNWIWIRKNIAEQLHIVWSSPQIGSSIGSCANPANNGSVSVCPTKIRQPIEIEYTSTAVGILVIDFAKEKSSDATQLSRKSRGPISIRRPITLLCSHRDFHVS